MTFDRVVIGAGIFGLYAAKVFARQDKTVLVLECDDAPFTRASGINQARLHMGYHYPRSHSTAVKTAHYFDRFASDYKDSINSGFDQIYAISSDLSLTSSNQYVEFCEKAGIRCDRIDPEQYFQPGKCAGAYLTGEYAFDPAMIRAQLSDELGSYDNVQIRYNTEIRSITCQGSKYMITTRTTGPITTGFILNASYASINQIQAMAGLGSFDIKYELCELILCKVSGSLKNTGITVMDGPFFSIMPFGKSEYHTLSCVNFTPHLTSYDILPTFDCQQESDGFCSPESLGNCNNCPVKPKSAWLYMSELARKYLRDEYSFEYVDSLFSMKPILKSSEADDSRPTLVRTFSENPVFVSVLSGKINTIYDLDEVFLPL